MKKFIERLWENTAFFLISNAIIGLAVVITGIGLVVGIVYASEKARQLVDLMLSSTTQNILGTIIGTVIMSAVLFVILVKLGNYVREKVIDELQMIRWRHKQKILS